MLKIKKYYSKLNSKNYDYLNNHIEIDLFKNSRIYLGKFSNNINKKEIYKRINVYSFFKYIENLFYNFYKHGKNINYINFDRSLPNNEDEKILAFFINPKLINKSLQRINISFKDENNNIIFTNNSNSEQDNIKEYDYVSYNLYDINNNIVGNIFYEKGIIIIKNQTLIDNINIETPFYIEDKTYYLEKNESGYNISLGIGNNINNLKVYFKNKKGDFILNQDIVPFLDNNEWKINLSPYKNDLYFYIKGDNTNYSKINIYITNYNYNEFEVEIK